MPTFRKLLRATGFLLWPVYWLSGLVRRDSRLWVFTSRHGRTFTDNAKWLYLACQTDARVDVVWLTRSRQLSRALRDRGLRAYHLFSWPGLMCSLSAGVYVFDNSAGALNFWLSRGATWLNLWHGVPLKKIEADMPRTSRYYRHFSPWSFRGLLQRFLQPSKAKVHDYIVATSERIGEILAGAFKMRRDQALITGYPRNDPLFDPTLGVNFGEVRPSINENERFRRVVGYLPTFRERSDSGEVAWDWTALDADLRARSSLLVVKLHPTDTRRFDGSGLTNIRILEGDLDPYPLLPQLDVLITDYSSIYFDYLLLDRPVLFFPYDLEHYKNDERGLYFEYDDVTPGPKVRTFVGLREGIGVLLDDYEKSRAVWRARRKAVVELCHQYVDGLSSRRIVDSLIRDAGDGAAGSAVVSGGKRRVVSG